MFSHGQTGAYLGYRLKGSSFLWHIIGDNILPYSKLLIYIRWNITLQYSLNEITERDTEKLMVLLRLYVYLYDACANANKINSFICRACLYFKCVFDPFSFNLKTATSLFSIYFLFPEL